MHQQAKNNEREGKTAAHSFAPNVNATNIVFI
jgi:hypothetical protein